jgi:hypothetical protein
MRKRYVLILCGIFAQAASVILPAAGAQGCQSHLGNADENEE